MSFANMAVSDADRYGWIIKTPHQKAIDLAHKRFEKKEGPHFDRKYTKMRWTGDLGEIMFAAWLRSIGIPYQWFPEKAYWYDLIVNSVRIDVKTMNRKADVQSYYEHGVNEEQVIDGHDVDQYFWMSYNYIDNEITFVGGMPKQDFLNASRFIPAGEEGHKNWTAQEENGGMHDIHVTDIPNPEKFLAAVTRPPLPFTDHFQELRDATGT